MKWRTVLREFLKITKTIPTTLTTSMVALNRRRKEYKKYSFVGCPVNSMIEFKTNQEEEMAFDGYSLL
jgi:hypothetical protein